MKSTGIVIRCCDQYYVVWGKDHGCVLVTLGEKMKNGLSVCTF